MRTLVPLLLVACTSAVDKSADTDTVHTDTVDTDTDTDTDAAVDSDEPALDTDDPADVFCATLTGSRWGSVEEQECGLGPDGVVMCTWVVRFTDTGWTWDYSDVTESGAYACDAGNLTVPTGETVGAWEPTSERLIWRGLPYAFIGR